MIGNRFTRGGSRERVPHADAITSGGGWHEGGASMSPVVC